MSTRADRLALAAFAWTIVAGLALALLPTGVSSTTTTGSSSGVQFEHTTEHSLLEHEGAGILIVLAIPAALAFVALRFKHHRIRLALAGLLLIACLLGIVSVGLFFLPAPILLFFAAAASPQPVRQPA